MIEILFFSASALVVWVVLVIVSGAIAASRGRSVIGWVLLAIFVAPITMLILLALPSRRTDTVAHQILAEQRRLRDEQERSREAAEAAAAWKKHLERQGKTCPRCAETVKTAALVCRFCGHSFEAQQQVTPSPAAPPPGSGA